MYRSNLSKKYNLLDKLRNELVEAREGLEEGTTRDKIENIFFLENAIDELEYDISNSDY